MKKILYGLSFILVVLFAGCQSEDFADPDKGSGTDPRGKVAQIDENYAIPGQLIVKLSQEPADENAVVVTRASGAEVSTGLVSLDVIAREIGATNMVRVFPPARKFEPRSRKAGLHLWYVVDFDQEIPVTRAADRLAESEYIDIVEPSMNVELLHDNSYVEVSDVINTAAAATRAAARFNDPFLPYQWHYVNDGSGTNWIAGSDARLSEVWEDYTGHPDIIVCVVDTGVGYAHEDLAANMWVNTAELNGADGVDDDGNGYVDDIHGYNFVYNIGEIYPDNHGTHVAGTVAAVNNNGIGVSGIAGGDGTPNSGVKIMGAQIMHYDRTGTKYNATTARTLAAIKYGADNGAVISQNSWGYGAGNSLGASLQSHIDVINYFIENAGIDENGNQVGPMKGGLVVFSAGNDGSPLVTYPAAIEGVVSVAASDYNYKKAGYSNYGNWVTITAPGGDYGNVVSTVAGFNNGVYVETYGNMTGTSMASPHVSGVAALYIQKYGLAKQGLTPDQVKEALYETAYQEIYQYNPSYIGRLGTGGLDATAALAYAPNGGGDEPLPPVLINKLPQLVMKGVGTSHVIDLGNHFRDPQGEAISYWGTADPTEDVVWILFGEGKLNIFAEGAGMATVTIHATNESDQTLTETMKVIVLEDGSIGGADGEGPEERDAEDIEP